MNEAEYKNRLDISLYQIKPNHDDENNLTLIMNNHPLINYLSKSITFSNEEELLILSKVKSRKYLKGQYVVQQGDTCRYLSFVVEGATRTFHIDDKGKEHTFRFAIKNWWAVDLPSFNEQNAAFTNVQCLENTELVQFQLQGLEELYIQIPKLERFFRILFQKVSISLEKRIINTLSLSAKDQYLLFVKEYPDFEQRIPQYMIASYLGITKQYLSEIRHQLASD